MGVELKTVEDMAICMGNKEEGSSDCGGAGQRGGVVDGRAYIEPVVWHRLFGLLNIM